MQPPSIWRLLAGGTALLSATFMILFYGRFALAYFGLPVPLLHLPSLSPGSVASGQTGVSLRIAKLGLEAPVQSDVPVDALTSYTPALEQGVALAVGSAELGAKTGNSFIFGHSSRLSLTPSPYDTIFAGLPRLEVGDSIDLNQGSSISHFQVILSTSIASDETQYLLPTTDRRLTLLTCWPLGTNFRRWVVQAIPQTN